MMNVDLKENKEIFENILNDEGFDLVGFCAMERLEKETELLKKWLALGNHAGMNYMERNVDKRENPNLIMDTAKGVITVGLNYFKNPEYSNKKGKVSRYALGRDYHTIMWEKLESFTRKAKLLNDDYEFKYYVDTGPVMDKVWAVKSGLGWMGKNTNVINRDFGSWFFIGVIFTNVEFANENVITGLCGTCRKCINACPTGALEDAYHLNSHKCISYLTIENKGEIPGEFKGKFDKQLFGCDICQEVCPWNKKSAKESKCKEFNQIKIESELDIEAMINMSEDDFKKSFKGTPIERTRLKGIKRNAIFIKD